MTGSSASQLASESMQNVGSKCGICYEEFIRKRTVSLGCKHVLHRTCLVQWAESKCEEAEIVCPICDVPLGNDIQQDSVSELLPKIIAFGPTGEPSFHSIVQFLEPSESETERDFENGQFDDYMDKLATNTAERMLQTSHQLAHARKSGKSEEYIQDIVDEKNKLLDRFKFLEKINEDFATAKARISAEEGAPNPNDHRANVAEDVAAHDEQSADVANNGTPPVCSICFEALANKRIVTLEPCKHEFHRTCALKWFEYNFIFNQSWIDELSCCLCRTRNTKVLNQHGFLVPRIFPYEVTEDVFMRTASQQHAEYEKQVETMNQARTQVCAEIHCLLQQKRLSLKNGKTGDYITDFDEEIMKLRKRLRSMEIMFLHWTEIKANFSFLNIIINRVKAKQAAARVIQRFMRYTANRLLHNMEQNELNSGRGGAAVAAANVVDGSSSSDGPQIREISEETAAVPAIRSADATALGTRENAIDAAAASDPLTRSTTSPRFDAGEGGSSEEPVPKRGRR